MIEERFVKKRIEKNHPSCVSVSAILSDGCVLSPEPLTSKSDAAIE
jgi:hypothetical protein